MLANQDTIGSFHELELDHHIHMPYQLTGFIIAEFFVSNRLFTSTKTENFKSSNVKVFFKIQINPKPIVTNFSISIIPDSFIFRSSIA